MPSKSPHSDNPGASTPTAPAVNRLQTPLVLVGGFFRMCLLTVRSQVGMTPWGFRCKWPWESVAAPVNRGPQWSAA